jgi:hypothetical protein
MKKKDLPLRHSRRPSARDTEKNDIESLIVLFIFALCLRARLRRQNQYGGQVFVAIKMIFQQPESVNN